MIRRFSVLAALLVAFAAWGASAAEGDDAARRELKELMGKLKAGEELTPAEMKRAQELRKQARAAKGERGERGKRGERN